MLLSLPVQNSITEIEMARQIRKKSGTGVYHVMLRGINRQDIFEGYSLLSDLIREKIGGTSSDSSRSNPLNLLKWKFGELENSLYLCSII